MQKLIYLFRSWNTIPRAQNVNPKFEFQTLLAQNSPVGTSELLPFGANSDLTRDWIFLDIFLGGSSLILPVRVYYASTLLRKYTNNQKEQISYVTLDPVTDYTYI